MIFSYKKKGENYHSEKKKIEGALALRQTGCLLGENENLLSCERRGRRGGVHTRGMAVGTPRARPKVPAGSGGWRHLQIFLGGTPCARPHVGAYLEDFSGEASMVVSHL